MAYRAQFRSDPGASEHEGAGAWLTNLAFVMAIALVLARAMFPQALREPELAQPSTAAVPHGAGAAEGIILDLLLCVPALLVMLRRAMDARFRPGRSFANALFVIVALLALVSGLWASDKFAAVVTASHMLGAAALMWAVSQLVDSWARIKLIAAGCFALLLVYIAQAGIYRFIDVPDNVRYWQQHKEEELRKRGWEPDSFQAVQFERKLTSGEMIGFNTSPNTFAAMLVMLGVVSAGAAIQRLADRDEPGWAVSIVIALALAGWVLLHTQSKAALATPFVAAAILLAIHFFGHYMARYRKSLYIAGAAMFCAIALMIGAAGVVRGSLFVSSLTFRWHYWNGALKVLEQHPLLGVGWSNFAAHYLGMRLPVAAEEVKDPHNFIVRAFVELGLFGGALMLAWLARLAWELSGRTLPLRGETGESDARLSHSRHSTAKTIVSICVGASLLAVLASVDFSSQAPGGGWYIVLQLFEQALSLGLLLLGFAAVALRSSHDPRLDSRPAPWILYAIIAAVTVFLLHNLIDFSMFEPGPLGVLAMLVGAAVGAKTASSASEAPPAIRWALAATACVVWLAAALGLVAPVAVAETRARHADELLRAGQPSSAAAELRRAFSELWIPNADYAYRASLALQWAHASPGEARDMLDRAVKSDPMNGAYYRARAAFELAKPAPDAQSVISDFEKTIELNPNEIATHLDFADALLRLGLRQRAIDEFRTALRYNDLLDPNEPERLSREEIQRIMQTIESLGG